MISSQYDKDAFLDDLVPLLHSGLDVKPSEFRGLHPSSRCDWAFRVLCQLV